MRRLSSHAAYADVDARLAKIMRQQLGMAIREMHQRHVVAEAVQIVKAVDCSSARVAAEWKAGCTRYRKCVQKFAPGHRHIIEPTLKSQAAESVANAGRIDFFALVKR